MNYLHNLSLRISELTSDLQDLELGLKKFRAALDSPLLYKQRFNFGEVVIEHTELHVHLRKFLEEEYSRWEIKRLNLQQQLATAAAELQAALNIKPQPQVETTNRPNDY